MIAVFTARNKRDSTMSMRSSGAVGKSYAVIELPLSYQYNWSDKTAREVLRTLGFTTETEASCEQCRTAISKALKIQKDKLPPGVRERVLSFAELVVSAERLGATHLSWNV